MNVDVEQVVREYIDKTVHMSLATVKDNAPWVCEVRFAYDDELNLYFRSLSSRRHSLEIADNPNVAGNIVRQHSLGEMPAGAYFEGTAELLGAGDEQNKASECITQRLHIDKDILEEAKHEDGAKFYKISVHNWYVFGRFNDQPVQKYKLEWKGDKSNI